MEVFHKGPPMLHAHPLNEYVEPLLDYEPSMKHHIICDRWHLGELVYPKVVGRTSRMDRAALTCIELFLEWKGASITVLRPPFAELMARYAVRGDTFISSDRMIAVWKGFEDLANYSPPLRTADEVVAVAEGATVRAMRNR